MCFHRVGDSVVNSDVLRNSDVHTHMHTHTHTHTHTYTHTHTGACKGNKRLSHRHFALDETDPNLATKKFCAGACQVAYPST